MTASAMSAEPYRPAAPYGIFIGGEETPGSGSFDAVNPSTGEVWATVADASGAQVAAAVQAARAAFTGWRRSSPEARQQALLAIADAIESGDDWPRLLATENGRPIREADQADVPFSAAVFRYYAGLVRGALHGEHLATGDPASRVFTVREPLGASPRSFPGTLRSSPRRSSWRRRWPPATPSCSSPPNSPPRASSSSPDAPPRCCRRGSSTSSPELGPARRAPGGSP